MQKFIFYFSVSICLVLFAGCTRNVPSEAEEIVPQTINVGSGNGTMVDGI